MMNLSANCTDPSYADRPGLAALLFFASKGRTSFGSESSRAALLRRIAERSCPHQLVSSAFMLLLYVAICIALSNVLLFLLFKMSQYEPLGEPKRLIRKGRRRLTDPVSCHRYYLCSNFTSLTSSNITKCLSSLLWAVTVTLC